MESHSEPSCKGFTQWLQTKAVWWSVWMDNSSSLKLDCQDCSTLDWVLWSSINPHCITFSGLRNDETPNDHPVGKGYYLLPALIFQIEHFAIHGWMLNALCRGRTGNCVQPFEADMNCNHTEFSPLGSSASNKYLGSLPVCPGAYAGDEHDISKQDRFIQIMFWHEEQFF